MREVYSENDEIWNITPNTVHIEELIFSRLRVDLHYFHRLWNEYSLLGFRTKSTDRIRAHLTFHEAGTSPCRYSTMNGIKGWKTQ